MGGLVTSPSAECSLGALLAEGRALLGGIEGARLEAEILLAAAAELPRSTLLAFPERTVAEASAARFRASLERRARGEPLAYVTGRKEFYSLELEVTADVLVPRPETELLVDEVLARCGQGRLRVLDLGTGSGALALALKHERPMFSVTGSDFSAAALGVARRNGERLGLAVRWCLSRWFEALADERFDCIVCNPPYVPSDDAHFGGALRFEPRLALDGGEDGLAALRLVLAEAPRYLRSSAWLMVEHGYDQQGAVAALARERAYEIAALRADLGGQPRVAVLQVH